MRLIYATVEGLPYEFLEDEAVELYLSLQAGLREAGVDIEKLKALPAPKGSQAFNEGDGSDGVTFFGNWPVLTDC